MSCSSLSQLNAQIINKIKAAMASSQYKAMDIMRTETNAFYSQGSPKVYKRTHKLTATPTFPTITSGGNSVTFEAKLTPIGYTTGTFSGEEVLDAAENHISGVLGQPHFWQRSEEQIKNAVEMSIASII